MTDFGLVKFIKNQKSAKTFCGTIEYLSPERILDRGCTRAGDWWGLGIIIYEMLFGKPPFYSQNQQKMMKKTILEKLKFSNKIQVSEDAKDLLLNLLKKSPVNRLGTKSGILEFMNHRWFKNFDWGKLLNKNISPLYKPLSKEFQW